MGKANKQDMQLVAAVISTAEAGAMRERLTQLLENDFPVVASLVDVLAEHPAVDADTTLLGAVSAVQVLLGRFWERVEAIVQIGGIERY